MSEIFAVFHLNLAFSSIEPELRPLVITRCYEPLLNLVEHQGIPLGIEATGWTLEKIAELRPEWIVRFRRLLASGRCELVGSGYVQSIGPLIPYKANLWNQEIGLDIYDKLLGVRPKIALVNEMAFSSGLVGLYLNTGYNGIIADLDNARLAWEGDKKKYDHIPQNIENDRGDHIAALWAESILFQRFQRYVHSEISLEEYLAFFKKRMNELPSVAAVYCSDAEVFDFRPGRFTAEAKTGTGEWLRISELFCVLTAKHNAKWLTPSKALEKNLRNSQFSAAITRADHPIIVKKQAKYNLVRWAVNGRDNLWLNSNCHRIFSEGIQSKPVSDRSKRTISELWSSDFRTHITKARWIEVQQQIAASLRSLPAQKTSHSTPISWDSPEFANAGVAIDQYDEGFGFKLKTKQVEVLLNARRGLTISSLSFKTHDFIPTLGLVAQGYFTSIQLGADWYSGGTVVDLPGKPARVTDLTQVKPVFSFSQGKLAIESTVSTSHGEIKKRLTIDNKSEQISLRTELVGFENLQGSFRVAQFSMLPEAFKKPIFFETQNGGERAERFCLENEVDHGSPVSTLVSCRTGIGATGGWLTLGNDSRALKFMWNLSECAPLPLLSHQSDGVSNQRESRSKHLTRVSFSLGELDDTAQPGRVLLPFEVTICPAPIKCSEK